MKILATMAILAAAVSTAALQDPPKGTTATKPADVKWGDHPFLKGGKMHVQNGDPAKGPSVLLMKFPKGMTIPAHWHTSDEVVTVVAGKASFGTGETVDAAKGTEVSAGGYLVIPGKDPHWAVVSEDLTITVTLNKAADFHLCGEEKK